MADLDFTNHDSRMKFLEDNLGKLMNGIDSSYSKVMMDELVRRLEKTVSDFNEEVKALLSQLQGEEPEAEEMIGDTPAPIAPKPPSDALSAFEKKLQSMG
jgi:hypothetical protein